ncbi:hypothetical protein [Brevundimonas sp.]|uniref:hypothetical protein n=1 Tax=Brevundimonas sp. TaxID=1871086 RepID=UPI002D703958|nr:hypothetical protein [Brevundimonas sp.]HYC66696.1 hypothetical protein [Brevundimonas sp.]
MSIRNWAFAGGVIAAAAVAGVATSQQQPPSPVAATQVNLTPSRVDNAALAQARQDPVAARLRGVLAQSKGAGFMQQVNASAVPVLAPADPALLATAEFSGGDRFYMLTVQRGEQIIEIYGTTKAFQSPLSRPASQPAAPRPTARPAAPVNRPATRAAALPGPRITAARVPPAAARSAAQAQASGLTDLRTERTEYGVDVTFSRFGAAYNVSFLCEGAPNCAEADAIAFAAGLQLIGGGAS